MKSRKVGNVLIASDLKGNLFVTCAATVPILKENAERIFSDKSLTNLNDGLFKKEGIGKSKYCLSVMPDDVIKTLLTQKQVKALRKAIFNT